MPKLKCDRVVKMNTSKGVRSFVRRDCLVMEECPHNLLSLGRMAKENNLTIVVGAGDADSHVVFDDRTVGKILNVGVLVLEPLNNTTPWTSMAGAAVTQGTRTFASLPKGVLHRRCHAYHARRAPCGDGLPTSGGSAGRSA